MIDPFEKIQHAINHLLQQDLETMTSISEIAGKIIEIEIIGPDLKFWLQFHDHGITLMKEFDGKPHVTIGGRPGTFAGLLLDRDNKTVKPAPDMDISGDVILAQDFQRILHSFEIDREEQLSHWVGDMAAHKLGRIFRHTREYLQETQNTIGLNVSEYLRYEKDILPDRDEVEEFIADVDVLRNDTERIRQRIERLMKTTITDPRHG